MLIKLNSKVHNYDIEGALSVESIDQENKIITFVNKNKQVRKVFKYVKKRTYSETDLLIIHIGEDTLVESYSGNLKTVKGGFYMMMMAHMYTDTDYGFDFDTTGRDYVEIIVTTDDIDFAIEEIV